MKNTDELRARWEADLVAEHGQEWLDANKGRLDLEWAFLTSALSALGT
jgi:hypothetical protein